MTAKPRFQVLDYVMKPHAQVVLTVDRVPPNLKNGDMLTVYGPREIPTWLYALVLVLISLLGGMLGFLIGLAWR